MATASSGPTRVYGGLAADERRAARRERLLEAGLDLLGTEGWQATTVTAVCERARLTSRYFYESFRDRDELLLAIFDSIVEEVAGEVRGSVGISPPSVREFVRASITAWVKIASEDPRKGRVAFVEALGSEALMRRRLDATGRFAEILAEQARPAYDLSADEARRLELASMVVAGGLIETMIEWLDGGLDRPPDELIEDFTRVCSGSLEAAIDRRRPARGRSRPRSPGSSRRARS